MKVLKSLLNHSGTHALTSLALIPHKEKRTHALIQLRLKALLFHLGTQALSTQAPNVDKVKITYTLANVDYAKVKSDEKMMSDLISAVQEGVLVGLISTVIV